MSKSSIKNISVKKKKKSNSASRSIFNNIKTFPELYLMVIPYLIWLLIFQYGPMYGVLIGFKDYNSAVGVTKSPWTDMYGFKHFYNFLTLSTSKTLILNTLRISIVNLLVYFPLPILLAIGFHHIKVKKLAKAYQTISYIPNFISTVVTVGIMGILLNGQVGVLNKIINYFGGQKIDFLNNSDWFVWIYVGSGIWTGLGWSTIIYTGALSNISPELYEAAEIDGANKWQQIKYIEWPSIAPLVSVMLILSIGGLMSVGWEKAYLLRRPLNLSKSEIISTYTYQQGILGGQYSYTTAIGLFNSVVNIILLLIANGISKLAGNNSLF